MNDTTDIEKVKTQIDELESDIRKKYSDIEEIKEKQNALGVLLMKDLLAGAIVDINVWHMSAHFTVTFPNESQRNKVIDLMSAMEGGMYHMGVKLEKNIEFRFDDGTFTLVLRTLDFKNTDSDYIALVKVIRDMKMSPIFTNCEKQLKLETERLEKCRKKLEFVMDKFTT